MKLLSRKELFESGVKDLFNDVHHGDLDLKDKHLLKLPDDLPNTVTGTFDCSINELTTLVGAPEEVLGNFYCSWNSLTSLVGAPKKIKGTFRCNYNFLESLEGCPEEVGGDFYCGNQGGPLKITKASVIAVCKVGGKIHC